MAAKLKPATEEDARGINRAIELLREARTLLYQVGAPKAELRTRLAIVSAEGARRHIHHRARRTEGLRPIGEAVNTVLETLPHG